MITVILISPKDEFNVAQSLRNLAELAGDEPAKLVVVNRRYVPATGEKGDRKPRPFRMKAYDHVQVEYHESIPNWAYLDSGRTVVVECLDWATSLPTFKHPKNPIYIFGPEDGNIPKWIIEKTKKYVKVETLECLNLAMAVGIVIYDKKINRQA
jgi:tRNA(Leu) C34 or U34 (ribose-2'-O)-methylase TrmL